MVNEAFTTRSKPAPYSAEDVELFRNGLDPELFPNVDWMDLILKKGAPIYRATVDLSGGGTTARYFVSASYVDEGGMYKTDEGLKEYNTNANYRRWNYRMNIDLKYDKNDLIKSWCIRLFGQTEPTRRISQSNLDFCALIQSYCYSGEI